MTMQTETVERVWQKPCLNHPPMSRLWQVPMFFLGLTAAALAFWHYPRLPESPAIRASRALKEAFTALECGDCDQSLQAAQAALELVDQVPQLAGDMHYAIGSAYLLKAASLSGQEAVASRAQALSYLEKAEQFRVSPSHQPRLAFRLIKARHLSGAGTAEIGAALEKVLETHAADRVEGYALLTEIWLAKTPPDLEAALHANEKLLAQAGLSNSNPVRLQRGELLLRLKRREEGRTVLARIPPEAPEYFVARRLRALSLLENEQWQEAAEIWQETAKGTQEDTHQGRQARHYLGVCFAHLGRTRDALQVWQRLEEKSPDSDEAVAAAFQRGQARHVAGQQDQAMAAFAAALRTATPDKSNRYLDLATMRHIVEDVWSRWLEAGDFIRARELAQRYRRIALPGEAEARLGQTSEAAGFAKLHQSEVAAGARADDLAEEARQLFVEAAEAFAIVAREHESQPDHADHLWAWAQNLIRAQDYRQALPLLEKCLTFAPSEAHRQELTLCLAESHQALGQTQSAVKLLTELRGKPGPWQIRARFLLGLTHIDQGRLAEERARQCQASGQHPEAQAKEKEGRTEYDAAEVCLREILALPAQKPEPPEIRQAHFALAYVLYQRRQYNESTKTAEEALARYPAHPQSMQARYWLAEAYREASGEEARRQRSADTDAARKFYEDRHKAALEKALANYRHVALDLVGRQLAHPLKLDQQSALRDARFAIGECLFNLQRREEAADVFEELAANYANRPDGLEALLNLAECRRYLGKMDQARLAIERCRSMLAQIDDKDLQPPRATRPEWLESIEKVVKACEKP
jgi:tetratricopeptide (TPR) repeat protein